MDGVASFDEIFRLNKKRRSEPYDKYFANMDLTDEQIKERISFSEDAEDVLLFAISLIAIMKEFDALDREYALETLTEQFRGVVGSYMTIDEYLDMYIGEFATDFVDTTFENITDIWFLSEDRAMFDAENEANTTLNYKDYQKAILSGKKYKTWLTYGDSRVRKTHKVLDGKTIPIKDLFEVGKTFMRFPKDLQMASNYPESYVNCRCQIRYS